MNAKINLLHGKDSFWLPLAGTDITEEALAITKRIETISKKMTTSISTNFDRDYTRGKLFTYETTPLVKALNKIKFQLYQTRDYYLSTGEVESDAFIFCLKSILNIETILDEQPFTKDFFSLNNALSTLKVKIARWHNDLQYGHGGLIDEFRHQQSALDPSYEAYRTQNELLFNLIHNVMVSYEAYLSKRYRSKPKMIKKRFDRYFGDFAKIEAGSLIVTYERKPFTNVELVSKLNHILTLSKALQSTVESQMINIVKRQVEKHKTFAAVDIDTSTKTPSVILSTDHQLVYLNTVVKFKTARDKLIALDLKERCQSQLAVFNDEIGELHIQQFVNDQKYLGQFEPCSSIIRESRPVSIEISLTEIRRIVAYEKLKKYITNLSFWDQVTRRVSANASYKSESGKMPIRILRLLKIISSQDKQIATIKKRYKGLKLSEKMIHMKGIFLNDLQIAIEHFELAPRGSSFKSHQKITRLFIEGCRALFKSTATEQEVAIEKLDRIFSP